MISDQEIATKLSLFREIAIGSTVKADFK